MNRKVNPSKLNVKNKPNDALLDDIFKFQNIVLRIFGIYHRSTDSFVLQSYTIVMILLLWFNVLRHYVIFSEPIESLNSDVALKILGIIFPACGSIYATWFFIIQHQKVKITAFELCFDELFKKYRFSVEKEIHHIKRLTIVVICSALVLVAIFSGLWSLAFFGTSDSFNLFSKNTTALLLFETTERNMPYRVFCFLLISFTNGTWLLTVSYYFNNCFIVSTFLNVFNKKFKNFINYNEFKLSAELLLQNEDAFDEFKNWHAKLCDLIRKLDDIFKHIIAVSLYIFVPTVLLLLYSVSDSCIKGVSKIMLPLWAAVISLLIFIIIISASRINSKV